MKGAMIQSKVIDQEQWKEQLIRKQAIDQGVRDGSMSKGRMKDKSKERWVREERWIRQRAMNQGANDGSGNKL